MNSTNEVAVIVGATGAFGQAIVSRLCASGLDIIAVARSSESLNSLADRYSQVRPCEADIGDDSAIEVIRTSLNCPVRMVVHGPGVAVAGGVLDASVSALNSAVNIKVGGMLRLVRAVDDFLQPGSRLVAIGGHYGFEPSAYAAAAGVANAALANLNRQLSLAYGPRGITSHLVAPGPADTERLHRVAADRAAQRGVSVDAVLEEIRAESSLGALTTPEQVAWAISMLLAPEATAMSGSAVMLDSGRRRGLP
ncbi:short-chain dehydrogenase [Pseudomonas taiwanensis]|uniref:SDR family NAD(P)-dependent oxidoreductase n=1 Tax=Pseudomonas TaxID=286 RepID=UPI0015BAE426|nr:MULTISPECIES: SDR family oxidoreductase [Pseudomonas]MDH4564385.1 SDR family oxidoreductase [Pseudomonas sp. BN411]MDH4653747.1 SDR family oxidoreductase [Pseudomonas sp. BN606]MDH4874095.1 SDR family oxidoreductase [Pseudomonas sp. BN515]NWL75727.1 short-chain dehydrogenase [Pseudomonas taiwanensis]